MQGGAPAYMLTCRGWLLHTAITKACVLECAEVGALLAVFNQPTGHIPSMSNFEACAVMSCLNLPVVCCAVQLA